MHGQTTVAYIDDTDQLDMTSVQHHPFNTASKAVCLRLTKLPLSKNCLDLGRM